MTRFLKHFRWFGRNKFRRQYRRGIPAITDTDRKVTDQEAFLVMYYSKICSMRRAITLGYLSSDTQIRIRP